MAALWINFICSVVLLASLWLSCSGTELLTPNVEVRLPLNSIKWMHIQKTSSWIGDFLLMYACPHLRPSYDSMEDQIFFYDKVRTDESLLQDCEVQVKRGFDGSFGWHDPYTASVGNGSIVSIFRKPEYRLISSFLFNMMIPTGNVFAPNATLPEYVHKAKYPFIAYAQVPGMSSCQIKMVLGHYCGKEVRALAPRDVAEAKRRVEHDFAFVGLTEESVASAELFYAMYHYRGYTPYMQPATKRYRTHSEHSSEHRGDLLRQLRAHHWSDPPEQELYEHVRKIFYTRCAKYNISTINPY